MVNPGGGAYFDNTHAGAADLLLNRFDSSGVRTWATYYGGGNSEVALSVYKNGNKIYFCGRTQSGGFYTTPGAFQNSLSGGQDAFILVFDYNSVALLYSTFIGGTSNDEALDLKPWGNGIAIVGVTSSNNFPTINPGGNNYFDNTFGGISDGFLITMDNTYNFTWSTFIGGNGDDGLNAIYTTNNAIWLGGYSGDNTILQQSMGGTSYLQAFGGGTYDGYLVKLYECASNFLSTSYNSPLCEGSNLNLTANTGFYFNWTGPAGFTSTLQNPVISNVQTSQSGNYILEVIDQNGCRDTDTVVVNVNPLPTVTASSNSPICEGQTLNLSVNTTSGATYSWSGPNGFTSTQQNPSITNATTTASGTYTVTVTGPNGCSNSGSVSVTVNPLPTVTASSNSPICEGQTLNLSVNTTSGATYSWSGPNGFTSTQQNPSIANATTTASGIYTVTVTGPNGCSNSGSVSVTVNPLPTVTASSNSPICEGQTLNLSVNTTSGATYSWSGPNGFTSTQQNPSITNATTTASGTYTVTVTGANGCSNSGSVSVTVNPLPTVTASSNSPICEGQTLNLSVNTTSGATYSWNGPNGFTSTQQNPSIANATTTASGTYTVTVTGPNGCSNSGSVSVTVNPLPTVTASSNSPICEGQTLNLSVNTTSGATYSWSGPNGFTSTQQNPSIANATTTASGTYTVTVTGPNGCSNSGSVSVTVNPLPTVTASSNSPICEGQTLNLSVNTTSGATYSWSGPNGFTSTQQNPTITNATTNASGTYTVMVTGPNGCSNSGSVNVIINPKPVITITPDTVICEGDTITLTAGGGMSYLWNNGSTTSSITVSPGTTTTYQVVVTNAAGCQDSAEVVVTVNPPPIAQISGDNEICQGEKTKLTASGGNSYLWNNGNTSSIIEVSPTQTTTYQVIVSSGNCKDTAVITIVVHSLPIIKAGNDTTINQYGEAYLWADGGVYYSWDPTIGLSCDTCKETVARPEQTTQYCVTVTDSNGCENKSCVLVIVEYECGEIFVPNVFSPNGDGSNDYLFVYGNCIKDFLWEIYNRWGERVFLTNNPQQSWDGTYRGQSVNGGVYHYRLKVVLKNDQIIEKKGTITLVK
ncbi:MAG: hypothetical protein KatS3mg034_1993 [Vicingaceae bacterium]|nr:MAG: hypothetical protein KatS3mg034_1993 [Vicingaceae bacterium]